MTSLFERNKSEVGEPIYSRYKNMRKMYKIQFDKNISVCSYPNDSILA